MLDTNQLFISLFSYIFPEELSFPKGRGIGNFRPGT